MTDLIPLLLIIMAILMLIVSALQVVQYLKLKNKDDYWPPDNNDRWFE